MKKTITIVTIGVLSVFLFLSMLGMSRPEQVKDTAPDTKPKQEKTQTGTALGSLTLMDMNGKMQDLGSLIKGKTAIINVWATWCPSCKAEIPILNDLATTYSTGNVQIIGISVDRGGAEAVREFARSNPIKYPVLMDDGSVARLFSIRAIPTTLIVDREGNIVEKKIGYAEEKYFATMIKKLR